MQTEPVLGETDALFNLESSVFDSETPSLHWKSKVKTPKDSKNAFPHQGDVLGG